MYKSIQTELYKSIHNKYFAISMTLAFVIQLFSVHPWLTFRNEALVDDMSLQEEGITAAKAFYGECKIKCVSRKKRN